MREIQNEIGHKKDTCLHIKAEKSRQQVTLFDVSWGYSIFKKNFHPGVYTHKRLQNASIIDLGIRNTFGNYVNLHVWNPLVNSNM